VLFSLTAMDAACTATDYNRHKHSKTHVYCLHNLRGTNRSQVRPYSQQPDTM